MNISHLSNHFISTTAEPMLEKNLVRGSLMDINSQQLAIAGLLKKIRSNKSLTEDEVAEQAAKAVREHWQT